MQVASKVVGEHGTVLGIDLKEIELLEDPNICAIVADIAEPEIIDQMKRILPGFADVVISDVSPNLSGVWEVDHARQIDLARQSLRIAVDILKPEGNFFVKTFQGDLIRDLVDEIKSHFERIEIIKPPASRARSAEIYILGLRLKKQ